VRPQRTCDDLVKMSVIEIQSAWLTSTQLTNKSHFLTFSLLVAVAEHNVTGFYFLRSVAPWFEMFKMFKCFLLLLLLLFFCLRVTFRARVYFYGVFPDLGNQNFPQKVHELAERQYTASKKQAHVATELTC